MKTELVGLGENSLAVEYLLAVRDFALAKGINASQLLEGSELPVDVWLNPPARIGELSMHRVGVNLLSALDEPMVACIEFGNSMLIGSHGLLGIAVQGCANVREAMEMLVHFLKTRATNARMALVECEDFLCLRMLDDDRPITLSDHRVRLFFDLSTLINIERIGRQLVGEQGGGAITTIRVNEAPLGPVPEDLLPPQLALVFGCEHLELCVPRSWLDVALPQVNADLAMAAADRCEQELRELTRQDLLVELRRRIREADGEVPSLEAMAAQLFMSPSTLQRRLRAEGSNYQQLKTEELMASAQRLLSSTAWSVERIAEQLGYSDASNFSKAFKARVGLTPKGFRDSHRA